MPNWIFYDSDENVHASRLVGVLRKLGIDIFFNSYKSIKSEYSNVMFVAEVDNIPEALLQSNAFLIGVSWSYDIERKLESECGRTKLARIFKRLNMLIVDCEHYYEKALSIGIDQGKLWRMPYGLDLELEFYRANLDRRNKSKTTMIYSNRKWEKNYGISDIFAAASTLANDNFNFKITLSNDGSLRSPLEKQYKDLLDKGFIQCVGKVSESQNSNLLRQADFFLSTSSRDGWSVSILEAMAIGTPVIVSSIGSNLDLIQDKISGFIFSTGLESSLVETIESAMNAINRPGVFSNIAKTAREKIEKEADLNVNLSRLLVEIERRLSK
jgi:glycosyltransferase involved in cell wall biosynthesis